MKFEQFLFFEWGAGFKAYLCLVYFVSHFVSVLINGTIIQNKFKYYDRVVKSSSTKFKLNISYGGQVIYFFVCLGSKWLSRVERESRSRMVDYNAPPNSCTLA